MNNHSDMIVLTPTHKLAREIKQRGVKSCTYHSFFRWCRDTCNPSQMGENIFLNYYMGRDMQCVARCIKTIY